MRLVPMCISLAAALAGGCLGSVRSEQHTTIPRPIVQMGSPIAYLTTSEEVVTVQDSIKGPQIGSETRRTSYTELDLRTCRRGRTQVFDGAVDERGWGREPGDLWVSADRGARSLKGGGLSLALQANTDKEAPRPGPTGAVHDREAAVLRLWDLDMRSAAVVPMAPTETVASIRRARDGRTLMVLVQAPGSSSMDLLTIDPARLAAAGEPPPRRRIVRAGTTFRAARLMRQDQLLAVVSASDREMFVQVFELSTGSPVREFKLDLDVAWTLPPDGDPWLVVAQAEDRRRCHSRVQVIDLERGTTRQMPLASCAAELEWLDSPPFVAVTGYAPGTASSRWLLDVARMASRPLPPAERGSPTVAETLYYPAGSDRAQYLVAYHLPTGRSWAATAPLGDIRFVAAEPSSQTLIVVNDRSTVFLFDARQKTLRRCPTS